jgi:hypothetical protein
MLGLSDAQLQTLMTFAADIPQEKRSTFLERVGAMLAMRGRGHFNDDDVADVTKLATAGLIHRRTDAA